MRARGLIWPLVGLLVVVAARRWVDLVEVRGSSMTPTLLPGDRLLAVRARPHTGAIVIAQDPREPGRELIKRVSRIGPFGIELRGDNPAASTDARTFGAVSPDAVEWRVVLRYAPMRRFGLLPGFVRPALSRGRSRRGASLPPTC